MKNSIAAPAGARRVFAWEFDGAGWCGDSKTPPATPASATVTITVRQFDDGTELRGVAVVLGDDEFLDVGEARELAAALLEAGRRARALNVIPTEAPPAAEACW